MSHPDLSNASPPKPLSPSSSDRSPLYVSLSDIIVGVRQRKEFKPKELEELTKSIQTKGLLHPIVITHTRELVAGERRLRAITELHRLGISFQCHGQPVPLNHAPVTFIGELSEADRREAELEENLRRTDLTWLEEADAIASIHKLRVERDATHTQRDTARALAEAKTVPGGIPMQLSTAEQRVSTALLVARHQNDPDVRSAPNASVAVQRLLARQEAQLQGKLASLANATATQRHRLSLGDARDLMRTIPPNTVDVILTDPPYGVDMHLAGMTIEHRYDDSRAHALQLADALFLEGFKFTKPRAILFMFCSARMFGELHRRAFAALWNVWPEPIIWSKGEGGPAPWGRAGFQRTYECILFAVKGRRELAAPGGPDIIRTIKRTDRATKLHGAAKPVSLYEHLLRLSAYPGDTVCDPFCGSGTIFPAAERTLCRAIGFEIDPHYHSLAQTALDNAGAPLPAEENDDGPDIAEPA